MKHILVIGGGLFAGRVFALVASGEPDVTLHVVNRGHYPLGLPGVIEYRCDRHDLSGLSQKLPAITFDAAVDFCAYAPGEISGILKSLGDRIKKYIFISTCSVYAPSATACTEESALIDRSDNTQNGNYVFNKRLLESELFDAAASSKTAPVILRPAFIYGPFNYAPREPLLIRNLCQGQPIGVPSDTVSEFQMVYVKDIAKAILACVQNEAADGRVFNLSGPERVTYRLLADTLCAFAKNSPEVLNLPAAELAEKKIPLPFPVSGKELYDGTLAERILGIRYTPFTEGMELAFDAFRDVYS